MALPRTGKTWLASLEDALAGLGNRPAQFGSATSAIGFFGSSGGRLLPTGALGGTLGAVGGSSGILDARANGGSGTAFTLTDVVRQLKDIGLLRQ